MKKLLARRSQPREAMSGKPWPTRSSGDPAKQLPIRGQSAAYSNRMRVPILAGLRAFLPICVVKLGQLALGQPKMLVLTTQERISAGGSALVTKVAEEPEPSDILGAADRTGALAASVPPDLVAHPMLHALVRSEGLHSREAGMGGSHISQVCPPPTATWHLGATSSRTDST